jgi:hypothetical protein
MFAVEPKMYITTEDRHDTTQRTKLMPKSAEILNGRLAMLGFVVSAVVYLFGDRANCSWIMVVYIQGTIINNSYEN